MYNLIKRAESERQELFIATAGKMHLPEAIIEKDFWVCLTLDYLFHLCKWKDSFAFKSGTSLSKSYGLIERFSEDIDLIMDWRLLGYEMNEPWEERSNTKQQEFIDDSRDRLFNFLADEFLPVFRNDMSEILDQEANVFITKDDSGTVCFAYPKSFSDDSILNVIRLEIGALAAWTPTQITSITSYAAEQYPNVFAKASTEVLTTTAARSFWEKATILHQEALRPEDSKVPARYSRHMYDLYQMSRTDVKSEAVANPELLEKVADFKMKFYPRKWAHYELARIGTLRLVPAKHNIPLFRYDYQKMKSMIFGEYPDFDEMIAGLAELENEINR